MDANKEMKHWSDVFKIIAGNMGRRIPAKERITAPCPCGKHVGSITIVIIYDGENLKIEAWPTVQSNGCSFPTLKGELTRTEMLQKVAAS